jgi:hypothetical protein
MEVMRYAYKILVDTHEGNRVRGRGVEPSGSLQGSVADSCEQAINLRVPQTAGNFLTCRATINFPKRNLLNVQLRIM